MKKLLSLVLALLMTLALAIPVYAAAEGPEVFSEWAEDQVGESESTMIGGEEEMPLVLDELIEAQKTGKLEEVFGSGTAAVISPVGKLRYMDDVMTIGDGGIGPVSQKLYDTVTGIQNGTAEDPFGWALVLD